MKVSHSTRALALDICDGLRAQPGRVALCLLAIAVGMVALTVLLAVLGGLENKGRNIVKELGVNTFAVVHHEEHAAGAQGALREHHVRLLKDNFPQCTVAATIPYQVPTREGRAALTVVATDSALFKMRQWPIVMGRTFDDEDLHRRDRYAVITAKLALERQWHVGDTIELRALPFLVIGVVDASGTAQDSDASGTGLSYGDRAVFVPRTLTPYWLNNRQAPSEDLDAIYVQTPDDISYREILRQAQALLAAPDVRVDALAWVTPESLLRGLRRLQRTIRITVGSLAVLCLVLGGTALVSLMVANVRDRVTEIGLRRALGASAKDIATLFVVEGCVVTAAAAFSGSLFTNAFLFLGRERFPVPLQLGANTLLLPVLLAVALGMLFSYWPAKVAAAITPSEALRND